MKKVLLILWGGLILIGGSCVKSPLGPVVVQGPYLYAVSSKYPDGYTRVYVIDTAIDSLIDTVLVAGLKDFGLSFGVSPDGSRLYLNGGVLDTKTKTLISGAVSGVPTPDGKYVIVGGIPFQLYDAKSNQLVFSSDSIDVRVFGSGQPFDVKRSLVYGVKEGYKKIGAFDYDKFRLARVIDADSIAGHILAVGDIVVSEHGTKLYYSSLSATVFTGIDLVRDKVVVQRPWNFNSSLAITPDDRHIYITDRGGFDIFPSTETVGVYSPLLERPLESVDVSAIPAPCTLGIGAVATDKIALSPDGRKAYISIYDFCGIIVIDTWSNEVKKVIHDEITISSLAIRSSL